MTCTWRRAAFSRRDAPGVLQEPCPSRNQRAQGRPGARRTRGLARKTVHQTRARAYRFGGNTPAFPAQWLTAYFALAPVTGFLATVIPEKLSLPRNLTPAPGRQAHTTSPYAWATLVFVTFASTASHRTFVTIASRPSLGETGGFKLLICPTARAKYFCEMHLTRIQVICPSG